jgi:hypothetical protein
MMPSNGDMMITAVGEALWDGVRVWCLAVGVLGVRSVLTKHHAQGKACGSCFRVCNTHSLCLVLTVTDICPAGVEGCTPTHFDLVRTRGRRTLCVSRAAPRATRRMPFSALLMAKRSSPSLSSIRKSHARRRPSSTACAIIAIPLATQATCSSKPRASVAGSRPSRCGQ